MKTLKEMRHVLMLLTVLLVLLLVVPATAMAAQPPVNLGETSSYAVLAGSTITNTGPTTINGDAGGNVGLYPGTSFPGQAQVTLSGTVHLADAEASEAKDALVTAYNDAAGRTPVTQIPTELGGTTLTAGVYDSADGTFQITGTLTLDAQGDPNAVFVFQTASTLITASSSNVSLINGARYCRTFWKVGSSATLGTNSHFVGHIFALTSITANTGATVQGQLLARNGAVTLDTNTITNGICATVTTTSTTSTSSSTSTTTGSGSSTSTTTGSGSSSTSTTSAGSSTSTTTGSGSSTTLTTSPGSSSTPTTASTSSTTSTTVAGSTTSTTPTTTVNGGKLPKTDTPWYNILLVGSVLAFFGTVGSLGYWRSTRKTHG